MTSLPPTQTKPSQGRGVYSIRNTGSTRSSSMRRRSGKVLLLGRSRYTIRFTPYDDVLTNEWHSLLSGCVRFCVWKLLFGEHIDRADKHVEHAIWAEAEEV